MAARKAAICPDPSVHGDPYRYCPYCTWTEADDMPDDLRGALAALDTAIAAMKDLKRRMVELADTRQARTTDTSSGADPS